MYAVGHFFHIFLYIFLPPNLLQMEINEVIKSHSYYIYNAENKNIFFNSSHLIPKVNHKDV